MPLYEYECDACGKRFEVIQKFSDPHPETCKVCGKGPVRRLMSSPAIQFKGSGFYITDYAKKSSSDAGSSGGGAGTSAEAKADAKSDAAKSGTSTTKSETSTKSDSATGSTSASTPAATPAPAKD